MLPNPDAPESGVPVWGAGDVQGLGKLFLAYGSETGCDGMLRSTVTAVEQRCRMAAPFNALRAK